MLSLQPLKVQKLLIPPFKQFLQKMMEVFGLELYMMASSKF